MTYIYQRSFYLPNPWVHNGEHRDYAVLRHNKHLAHSDQRESKQRAAVCVLLSDMVTEIYRLSLHTKRGNYKIPLKQQAWNIVGPARHTQRLLF